MSASARSAINEQRMLTEICVRDDMLVSFKLPEIWARDDNNIPRQVWGGAAGGGTTPLSASADPSYVSGAVSTPNSRSVSTSETSVAKSGGVDPCTYSWTGGETMTINSPTSPVTSFSGNVAGGESLSETFICTVTDALGHSAQTNEVTASVNNYGRQLNGPV